MVKKETTSIEEIIDIMVEKEIVLVPVIQEDGKLIGVVARLDILRQKLNEGFVTIDGREEVKLLKLKCPATAVCYLFQD